MPLIRPQELARSMGNAYARGPQNRANRGRASQAAQYTTPQNVSGVQTQRRPAPAPDYRAQAYMSSVPFGRALGWQPGGSNAHLAGSLRPPLASQVFERIPAVRMYRALNSTQEPPQSAIRALGERLAQEQAAASPSFLSQVFGNAAAAARPAMNAIQGLGQRLAQAQSPSPGAPISSSPEVRAAMQRDVLRNSQDRADVPPPPPPQKAASVFSGSIPDVPTSGAQARAAAPPSLLSRLAGNAAAAARPAMDAIRPVIQGLLRPGAAADAEYARRAAAREQQAIADQNTQSDAILGLLQGGYDPSNPADREAFFDIQPRTDAQESLRSAEQAELDRKDKEFAQFEAQADAQQAANEEFEMQSNLSPRGQKAIQENREFGLRYGGDRLANLQELARRRQAGTMNIPDYSAEQLDDQMRRWYRGEKGLGRNSTPTDLVQNPNKPGERIVSFGDPVDIPYEFGNQDIKTGVDPDALQAKLDLMRRGDYMNLTEDGRATSIFTKAEREYLAEERDKTQAERAEDPERQKSALAAYYATGRRNAAVNRLARELGIDAPKGKAGAQKFKSALNEITKGDSDASASRLAAAKRAMGLKDTAEESADPLMTKDGDPDPMAAQARMDAYGNAKATTDKGRRARATAAQITGDPNVNIAELDATTLVRNFITNLPNATQEQFNMLHEMARLHHVADAGKPEHKRWDYGIKGMSLIGPQFKVKTEEVVEFMKELQEIPEGDKKALEDARKRWAEMTEKIDPDTQVNPGLSVMG